jgi:hypothetical protein
MDVLMTAWVFFIGIIIGIVIGVALSYKTAVTPLHQRIDTLTTEPNKDEMKHYPFNQNNFRYIGDPIDGIQFEDDKIFFIQFNKVRTLEQDRIKNLIKTGNVEWYKCTIN